MEIFLEQIGESKKFLKTADHLAYVTYPLLNDEKILLIVADNLYNSLLKAMDSLLTYERYYKRISNIPENFENKFDIFRSEILKRYGFNPELILIIRDMKEIIDSRKKSSFEFIKRNNLVVLSNEFRVKTLNLKKVKDYITITKVFIDKINKVMGQNARRF